MNLKKREHNNTIEMATTTPITATKIDDETEKRWTTEWPQTQRRIRCVWLKINDIKTIKQQAGRYHTKIFYTHYLPFVLYLSRLTLP